MLVSLDARHVTGVIALRHLQRYILSHHRRIFLCSIQQLPVDTPVGGGMGQGDGQQESKHKGKASQGDSSTGYGARILQGDRKGCPYHITVALSVAFTCKGNNAVVYGRGGACPRPGYHITVALSVAFTCKGNNAVVYGRGGACPRPGYPCPGSLPHQRNFTWSCLHQTPVVSAPVLQWRHPVLALYHDAISKLRVRGACSVHARNGNRLRRGYRAGNRTRPPARRRGRTLRDPPAALLCHPAAER